MGDAIWHTCFRRKGVAILDSHLEFVQVFRLMVGFSIDIVCVYTQPLSWQANGILWTKSAYQHHELIELLDDLY